MTPVLLACSIGLSLFGRDLPKPVGRWIGQDGVDIVGPSSNLASSDVQDIHLLVTGLPKGKKVRSGLIQGLGGDEWAINGPFGPWRAEWKPRKNGNAADVYIEPGRKETGRPFTVKLTFDTGETVEFAIQGGKADPGLKVAGAVLKAAWLRRDGRDRVGPGASVGPDGFEDDRIALERLSQKADLQSVLIEAPGGSVWESGSNPKGRPTAELVRDPKEPTRAELFFQPDRDLKGKTLRVVVAYNGGRVDRAKVVVADKTTAKPVVNRFKPLRFEKTAIKVGRPDQSPSDGSVRLRLSGLPRNRSVVAASLTDGVSGRWGFRQKDNIPFFVEPFSAPLSFERASGSDRAIASFFPDRDETDATLTLRLRFDDGKETLVRFPGGPADTSLTCASPADSTVSAKPGDDLQSLADRYGTVRLAPGTYRLKRPLVLNRPTRLQGTKDAILSFEQPGDAEPWTAALKIHAGRTTLEGFSIRFSGPVRFARDVSHGPCVVGTTDDKDQNHHDQKYVICKNLDIESPPSNGPNAEESPRLFRLTTARGGEIVGCAWTGGLSEFIGGPWRIENNRYRGTAPHTFAFGVLSMHRPHDAIVRGNVVAPVEPCGRTWRFLILTDSGARDRVSGNKISGVGPRDDDTGPNMNAPEIVLTEAYRLHFEGAPLALSADSRIVTIADPQGDPARSGDVVAAVEGRSAGFWTTIAQALDDHRYLLTDPLPRDVRAISIATGFVGETFEANEIDARGGGVAANLVLVGNHFGTRVLNNRLLGGGEALLLTAAPTETPVAWGWSHAPFFGGIVEGNSLIDSARGGSIRVEHGPAIKPARGRVYLTMTVRDNLATWSPERLARLKPDAIRSLAAFTVGDRRALDKNELIVEASGNRVQGAKAAPLRVESGRLENTRSTRRAKAAH